jgi:hypothetical protein
MPPLEQAADRVTGCCRSLNENRRNPKLVGEFERFEISVVGGQIRAQETILLLQRFLQRARQLVKPVDLNVAAGNTKLRPELGHFPDQVLQNPEFLHRVITQR